MARAVRCAGVGPRRTRPSRRPAQVLACSSLLAATALLWVPLASARAADVSVAAGVLTFRDAVGQRNVVDVVPDGATAYYVVDQGATILPGAGCTAFSEQIVRCDLVTTSIAIYAGTGDDVVDLHEVTEPVTMLGEAGDDLLAAGSAEADIEGGKGLDSLIGGPAEDELHGGGDDDLLIGGEGDDSLSGNAGDDILGEKGEEGGSDVLNGGTGDDLLTGGSGDDTLRGSSGEDVLISGSGMDSVTPGSGDDRVFGSSSDDKLNCDSNDEVRGARPSRCGKARVESEIPTAWPPYPGAQGSVANAAVVAQYTPDVHRPGNARRFSLTIGGRQDRMIRIHVVAIGGTGTSLGSFDVSVRTRHGVFREVPGYLLGARSLLAWRL